MDHDFVNDEHRFWFGVLSMAASTLLFGLGWLFLDFGLGSGSEVASILAFVASGYLNLNALALLVHGLWHI